MSAIIIENGLTHYEAIGRGRPVILLHGWLGSWRYWVPTMDDLSDRFRAYAMDLWGFGDSDRRRDSYTISSYVLLLQRFMDEMGIIRAPLVGHALGGVVALHFAAQMPERVEQVMAVSTPLAGTAVMPSLSNFSGNGDDAVTRVLGRRQAATYPEVQLEASKADASAIVNSVRAVLQDDLRALIRARQVLFPRVLPAFFDLIQLALSVQGVLALVFIEVFILFRIFRLFDFSTL